MAIIPSSRSFQGGDMAQNNFGSLLKPGIPFVNFRDEQNKNGVKVFILGAYKVDSQGNGVWYKVVPVRDNFGIDSKEKFASQPGCPVQWFEAKVKTFAPSFAAVTETTKNNVKMKVYPPFGRITRRVLFNVAYVNNLSIGAQVIELPQWKCADQIDNWCKDPDRPMLNSWEAAIPVNLRLDKKGSFPTWEVIIDASKAFKLPEELADSDYLHNLDDVVALPNKQELYDKLRMIVPREIFDRCMADYEDPEVNSLSASATVVAETDDLPYETAAPQIAKPVKTSTTVNKPVIAPAKTGVAPAFTIPKSSTRTAAPPVAVADTDNDEAPLAPMLAQPSIASKAAAMAFLRKPTAAND